jgi:hypothetical protein
MTAKILNCVTAALAASGLVTLASAGHGQSMSPPPSAASQSPGASAQPGRSPDEPGRADRGTDTQGGPDARADRARAEKLSDSDIASAPVREIKRVTRHSAVIAGRPLAYTATAGTLTIRDDDGKPTASMFYVAYTTGGPGRPVTFLYNGGPGPTGHAQRPLHLRRQQ